MMTPIWTTIPPLARPTKPRQPCRRVAIAIWRTAAPAAKPARAKATSGAHPVAPTATEKTNAPAPAQAGQKSRSRSNSVEALRHGSTGAIAIRKSSMRPIGMLSRSKYGAPTIVRRSSSTSTSSGNNVPRSTTKAKTVNSTLLARNAPSRDSGESIEPGERSRSPRHAIRPSDTTTIKPKKLRNQAPTGPSPNACTDSITPDRVRNVPRIVREKVATSKLRFQTRSIPRRSCTSTEWMYAVPVNHGSSEAFSTGSHAHTPPQPSTS